MKNGKKRISGIFIFLILFLLLVTPVLAWNPFTWLINLFKPSNIIDATNQYDILIDTNYECRNQVYYDYKTEWETCQKQVICDKENKSCVSGIVEYQCNPKQVKITKTKQVCERKSYSINMNNEKKIFEFPQGYVCDYTETEEGISIVCDSIIDGNGDGKCSSGESCIIYDLTNKVTEKTKLNPYLRKRTIAKIEDEI